MSFTGRNVDGNNCRNVDILCNITRMEVSDGYLRYVGVIWLVFHVLQLILIRFT